MFDMTIMVYEYTQILCGNQKNYSENYFDESKEQNEEHAVDFLRFVAKSFLRCPTMEAAHNTMTPELMDKMKLGKLIQYINVPKAVPPHYRYQYVIDRVFLREFDTEIWVSNCLCECVRSGAITKFPKYYMEEELGRRRAGTCLRYFLKLDMPGKTIPQMYQYSCKSEFREYLKKQLLLNFCQRTYLAPIDYLHDALSDDQKDETFYHFYRSLMNLNFPDKLS